jgi:hypothetical protein
MYFNAMVRQSYKGSSGKGSALTLRYRLFTNYYTLGITKLLLKMQKSQTIRVVWLNIFVNILFLGYEY